MADPNWLTVSPIQTRRKSRWCHKPPGRRGTRGSRETPYLATRKSWQLDTPAKGPVLLEAFLEEVALAPAAELQTSRLGLRLAPDEMAEFVERLGELLDEFAKRPDDPS